MDTSEIKNMEAGKEMDDLVAEKVMGWHRCKKDDGWEYWGDEECRFRCGMGRYDGYEDDENYELLDWHPSGGRLWALEVVEKLTKKPWAWNIEAYSTQDGIRWVVDLWDEDARDYSADAYGDNLSLAICRVALMFALENEVK